MNSALVLTEIDPFAGLNQRTHHLIRFLGEVSKMVTVIHPNSRLPFSEQLLLTFASEKIDRLDLYHTCQQLGNINYLGYPYFSPSRAMKLGFTTVAWYRTLLVLLERFARGLLANRFFDLCVAQGPKPGLVAPRLRAVGIVGKVVYEDLDDFAGFFLDNPGLRKEVERFEQGALSGADAVVFVSEGLKKEHGSYVSSPVLVVPNGVDYHRFSAVKWYPRPQPVAIYTGSIEEWAGLDYVLEAVADVRRDIADLKLLILGSGTYLDELENKIRSMGLEGSVLYLGSVPYELLPHYLRMARVGIVSFQPSRLAELAFPLKMVEYIAAGLPVLGVGFGEVGRFLSKNRCGFTYQSPQELADQLLRLCQNESLRMELVCRGAEVARAYDWDVLLAREWVELQSLLGWRSSSSRLLGAILSNRKRSRTQGLNGEAAHAGSCPRPTVLALDGTADPTAVADAVLAYAESTATMDVGATSLHIKVPDEAWALRCSADLVSELKARGHNPEYLRGVSIDLSGLGLAKPPDLWIALNPARENDTINQTIQHGGLVCFQRTPALLRQLLSARNLMALDPYEAGEGEFNPAVLLERSTGVDCRFK